jgi:hypothetical protein
MTWDNFAALFEELKLHMLSANTPVQESTMTEHKMTVCMGAMLVPLG